jgi:hypothetical protein
MKNLDLSNRPVLMMSLDLECLGEKVGPDASEFTERLISFLPGLKNPKLNCQFEVQLNRLVIIFSEENPEERLLIGDEWLQFSY